MYVPTLAAPRNAVGEVAPSVVRPDGSLVPSEVIPISFNVDDLPPAGVTRREYDAVCNSLANRAVDRIRALSRRLGVEIDAFLAAYGQKGDWHALTEAGLNPRTMPTHFSLDRVHDHYVGFRWALERFDTLVDDDSGLDRPDDDAHLAGLGDDVTGVFNWSATTAAKGGAA